MFCCWVSQHLQFTGELNTIPAANTIQLRFFFFLNTQIENFAVFLSQGLSLTSPGPLIQSLSKMGHRKPKYTSVNRWTAHFTGLSFCSYTSQQHNCKIEICFLPGATAPFFVVVRHPLCAFCYLMWHQHLPAGFCRPQVLYLMWLLRNQWHPGPGSTNSYSTAWIWVVFSHLNKKPWCEPGPNPELLITF